MGRLQLICEVSRVACDILQPMLRQFYHAINSAPDSAGAKLKADASVFTIADGMVQHLLVQCLFADHSSIRFKAIVGEEDEGDDGEAVNITNRPYSVGDLVVPPEFQDSIDTVRRDISALASKLQIEVTNHNYSYDDITVFIDPIDGTREFSTGLGEQCSICIGFADSVGKAVAGVVYRPITEPATWASGVQSESFVAGNLDMYHSSVGRKKGLLTSNGGISKFIESLMVETGYDRVPSGGAGNKMLMLLEGKGDAYIQDRGVSRWDTAAAEAVIEAYGGCLSKLSSIIDSKQLSNYSYIQSKENQDFLPGRAALTPYNAKDKASVKKGQLTLAESASQVKPYANLCGLVALSAVGYGDLNFLMEAINKVQSMGTSPASFD